MIYVSLMWDCRVSFLFFTSPLRLNTSSRKFCYHLRYTLTWTNLDKITFNDIRSEGKVVELKLSSFPSGVIIYGDSLSSDCEWMKGMESEQIIFQALIRASSEDGWQVS